MPKLTIITNNAYDTVLVTNATGTWAHTIASAQFWLDALTVVDDELFAERNRFYGVEA